MLGKSALAAILLMISMASHACELDMQSVRREALELLRSQHPTHTFRLGDEDDVILMEDAELGLSNLRAQLCRLSENSITSEGRTLIKEHFDAAIGAVDESKRLESMPWEHARARLMLQLMPREYLQRMPGHELVYRPLADDVVIAIVLDGDTTYRYVRRGDLAGWSQGEPEAFAQAGRNLETISADTDMQVIGDDDKLVIVRQGDGFDAVRLFVPAVREAAAEQLGWPFFAAVPNRDFLIMWSAKNSARSQKAVVDQVKEDCRSESHPLSCHVFEVPSDGNPKPVRE